MHKIMFILFFEFYILWTFVQLSFLLCLPYSGDKVFLGLSIVSELLFELISPVEVYEIPDGALDLTYTNSVLLN